MLTKNNFFLIIFLCIVASSFSQTNTRKWRKTENDSMERALLLYDEANYVMALPIYEKLYTAHPKEEYLKYCYGRCALYRSDKHEVALTLLNEVYGKNKKIENIQLDLAKANHFNLKFDEALALIDLCLANKKAKPEMQAGVAFFNKMRSLTTSGFYTTEIGIKDIGYVGNVPNEWAGIPVDVLKQYGMENVKV